MESLHVLTKARSMSDAFRIGLCGVPIALSFQHSHDRGLDSKPGSKPLAPI